VENGRKGAQQQSDFTGEAERLGVIDFISNQEEKGIGTD
jgi:hypothetical protein